jgi:hypothetical protein
MLTISGTMRIRRMRDSGTLVSSTELGDVAELGTSSERFAPANQRARAAQRLRLRSPGTRLTVTGCTPPRPSAIALRADYTSATAGWYPPVGIPLAL